MAWNELDPSGCYFVCFRFGKQRFKRSLKTKDKHEADRLTKDLERTIQDVERGRLPIPENADVVTFLLSDGRVSERPKIADRLTLAAVFDAYCARAQARGRRWERSLPQRVRRESRRYALRSTGRPPWLRTRDAVGFKSHLSY